MTDPSVLRAAKIMCITSLAGDCAAYLADNHIPESRQPKNFHEHKCFHEAGHVVAWHAFGHEAYSVSVTEGNGGLTALWQPAAAEPVAVLGDEKQLEALQDFFGVKLDERRLRETTWRLMERHWVKVERLARELMEKRSLNEAQIAAILNTNQSLTDRR